MQAGGISVQARMQATTQAEVLVKRAPKCNPRRADASQSALRCKPKPKSSREPKCKARRGPKGKQDTAKTEVKSQAKMRGETQVKTQINTQARMRGKMQAKIQVQKPAEITFFLEHPILSSRDEAGLCGRGRVPSIVGVAEHHNNPPPSLPLVIW